ncbi:RNA polymerase sigma factor [Pedobacter sp.]|uniref:RNA polymerase sigma factor n=1 Tax=Pedobacter sp. TaxID=1411316 RepID=UPI003C5D5461
MVFYDKLSDKELALLLNNRDKLAYTEIYHRYKAVLFVHAFRMLKDTLETEDLIHDLFVRLWVKSAEYNTEVPLNFYLFRAVKNRVIDIFEHKRIQNAYIQSFQAFIDKGVYTTEELLFEKEMALLIEIEVSQLPKKMREVFQMSRKGNLSYIQIASELNISDKTVKKQVSNAIKILKSRLSSIFFYLSLLW